MAGAMKIYEMSATLTGTDKTGGTIRFKMADNATVDTSDPITIPSTNYIRGSYHKKLRLYCATAPDTQIDNLRAYTDGANSFGTGISVVATLPGVTWGANATSILSTVSLFDYTSGSPADLDAVDSAAITATGFGGDMLALQMTVASTASSGTLSAETLTFSFDEI